jgi:hypothetical protein
MDTISQQYRDWTNKLTAMQIANPSSHQECHPTLETRCFQIRRRKGKHLVMGCNGGSNTMTDWLSAII